MRVRSSVMCTARTGVTPAGARWNYRNAAEPKIKQAEYVALMAQTVDHLIETYGCRVVFFPQLYGRSSDLPLIQSIVDKTRYADQVCILSVRHDSDIQQAVISRMDMMIANRYHSAIFAIKQAVPVVCIAYEHKARGVMRQAGVEENRQAIRQQLQASVPILRKSARISSHAAVALLHCLDRGQLDRKTLADEIERM